MRFDGSIPPAPVAQLDRASDFESAGRPFESGRARHFQALAKPENQFRIKGGNRMTKIEPKPESVLQIKQPMVRTFSTGGGHLPGDTLVEGDEKIVTRKWQAISNALYNATGVRIREHSITREKLLAGLKASGVR